MNEERAGDRLIWFLTVALMASFLIFNTNSIGSIVLFTISLLLFLISAAQTNMKVSLQIGPMHIMVLFFGLYCLASAIWAWNSWYAVEKGITILEILGCISMLWVYYARQNSVEKLLQAVMWAGFIVTVYYFISVGLNTIILAIVQGSRAGSVFANVNNVAMISSYSIIIALYYAINKTSLYSVMRFMAMAIPSLILIAASGSRKGLVALVIGMLVVLAKRFGSKNFFINLFKISIVIVVTYFTLESLAATPLFAGVAGRMDGLIALITGEGKVDHSALQRQWYIDAGIEQFKKTPILGVGIGCPRILINNLFGHNAYTHNNYVELLCGGGICAFALYYFMYVYCTIQIIKYQKRIYDPMTMLVLLMILILLIMDYGAVSYYFKDMYFYFMIFFLHVKNMKSRFYEGNM